MRRWLEPSAVCWLELIAEAFGHGVHVFVAAAREVEHHFGAWCQGWAEAVEPSEGVGGLQSRDDPFQLAEELQGIEGMLVGHRAEYAAVTDAQALDALQRLSQLEGIIPALETAHAFAWLDSLCPTLAPGTEVVINLSGRGDKDVNTVAERLGDQLKPADG